MKNTEWFSLGYISFDTMLKSLSIHNYAIIRELKMDLADGLTAITGETGAGKSILMGALGLVLGDRADTSVLMQHEKKCTVEAVFNTGTNAWVSSFLAANELDEEAELVIRRELTANGKSRAFINDTPVNLDQLRELSSALVDLHSQFDTLQLNRRSFQQEVVDALCNHADALEAYQQLFLQWKNNTAQLAALEEQQRKADKEADYRRFIYQELEEAAFAPQELEELDAELKLLSNAEAIKQTLSQVYTQMKEGEDPLVQQIKILAGKLQQYAAYHPLLPALTDRLTAAHVELKDIASDLYAVNEEIAHNEERMAFINERLALGYKLLKKHGLRTTADLLSLQAEAGHQLESILQLGSSIDALNRQVTAQKEELLQKAAVLSKNRQQKINPFQKQVQQLLERVGMPNARIKVQLQQVPLSEFGTDQIDILFDANKSDRFEPLSKVASGGELSRLMLCIKSLVAGSVHLPTLIFDEIDTGISGEAARQVGSILKELSSSHQIITITHQPQIAGKAGSHFFVYKEMINSRVTTGIRRLTSEERIEAIARMLSGETPTPAALANAKELMN